MAAKSFSWLHFSDLHAGQRGQSWLWPTFKHQLFDDLREIYPKTGPWDAVIFSGDFTQQGTRAEFDQLDQILLELWTEFRALGSNPQLLIVPGNHDLCRPGELEPEAVALHGWWETQVIQEAFFEPRGLRYLNFCRQAFAEYTGWSDRLALSGIPIHPIKAGILPGDAAISLTHGEVDVGVVLLNSAWLQMAPGNYEGRLHVDARQILEVCDNDPDRWAKQHDVTLLVTHHPSNWLHPDSQKNWINEVSPPGRFDLHLFGHMHSAETKSEARAGQPYRNEAQSASLFGLEKLEDGGLARRQGYAAFRAEVENGRKTVRSWPRALREVEGGTLCMGLDTAFKLKEDNSYIVFDLTHEPLQPAPPALLEQNSDIASEPPSILKSRHANLSLFAHTFPDIRAHQNTRKVEQREMSAHLDNSLCCWLIDDWGLGSDGFIGALQQARGQGTAPVFRFDFSEYSTRERFLSEFRSKAGVSFEAVCSTLAEIGPALAIFDDIPIDPSADANGTLGPDIESLADAVVAYCPLLTVLLRSRRRPAIHRNPTVQLGPLDEPDLLSYVRDREPSSKALLNPHAIATLHRHTDGVPLRVDAALRDLEIVPLAELVNSNSDIAPRNILQGDDNLPPALLKALEELAGSRDDTLKRALLLLNAIAIFPQGEQLGRIKRFNGPHPFFAVHARELIDRGLIEAIVSEEEGAHSEDLATRRLVVPRTIRAAVRGRLSDSDYRDLNRKAADLIFGGNWVAGTPKIPAAYKFDNPRRSFADITNAGAIVLRVVVDSKRPNAKRQLTAALEIALMFCRALFNGHHYRSVVHFCSDLLTVFPDEGFEQLRANISYEYARSLRMTGDYKQSISLLNKAQLQSFPKVTQQHILVNLALAYEVTGDKPEALDAARKAVAIDRHNSGGAQAQGIIADLENKPDRLDRLIRLEATARRKGYLIAANNIALTLSNDDGLNAERSTFLLERVARGAGAGQDYYNAVRAIVRLAESALDSGRRLRPLESSQLMSAYHFAFAERFPTLLDQCHDVLWRSFKSSGDTTNLFNLFRQSSLNWRLRGQTDKEGRYLKDLARTVGDALQQDVRSVDRTIGYFLARSVQVALPPK